MKHIITNLLFATLLIACNTDKAVKDYQATETTDSLHEPDLYVLRQRLFDYFERHKHEEVFDTVDDTYTRYWGYTYRPNSVQAGHLLTNDKIHAVICYSDSLSKTIIVYLKEEGKWKEIYKDTALVVGIGEYDFPMYKDWNNDGIKDITVSNTFPMDKVVRFHVCLTTEDGKRIIPIKGFGNIYNPEAENDKIISSEFFSRGNFSARKYSINKDTIQELRLIEVYPPLGKSYDSLYVTFSENGKTIKTVKTTCKNLLKYLPAEYRRNDVEDYFSSYYSR